MRADQTTPRRTGRLPGVLLPHLQAWRFMRQIEQQELARQCGLTASTVSRLEHQRQRASRKTLAALAAALGISEEELLRRSPLRRRLPA